jgi:hypothetical protein
MSSSPKIAIYGANGYTGKLISEALANRGLPFYMVGRSMEKLEKARAVVEERCGAPFAVELATAQNTLEELVPLFEKVDVVINVSGPFMQIGWPILEAAYQANCHYIDTTGEQDWTIAIAEKYGKAFEEKGLLLSPACSYMWAAGALAAEVVLENEGVDSLDILYQIDNGLPSEASTKSFLRMVCNDQLYLENNEYVAWPWDTYLQVAAPHRNAILHALPWGGACEPVWFKQDERVRDCKVLTAIGEHLAPMVYEVGIKAFAEVKDTLTPEQREEWTNNLGDQIDQGEPPKDDVDVQRSVIICHGQGRTVSTTFRLNVSAPYTWTGEICAEGAKRLLNGQLKNAGFQSAAKAFGHRELLEVFNELQHCNLAPEIVA